MPQKMTDGMQPAVHQQPVEIGARGFVEIQLGGGNLFCDALAGDDPDATAEVTPGIGQAPGLNQDVVKVDDHRHQHAERTQVARDGAASPQAHDRRCGVEALAAAVPPHGPFGPADRNAEQQKRNEIGDEEGAAAVLCGVTRKAQEIAEPDGRPGHRQDDTEPGTPGLPVSNVAHDACSFARHDIVFLDGVSDYIFSCRRPGLLTERGRQLWQKLERVKGIEPSFAAWEAAVLPLNDTRLAVSVANSTASRRE